MDTSKVELEPPAFAVRADGSAAILKSLKGSTLKARVADRAS
jgi:hypothetical protein